MDIDIDEDTTTADEEPAAEVPVLGAAPPDVLEVLSVEDGRLVDGAAELPGFVIEARDPELLPDAIIEGITELTVWEFVAPKLVLGAADVDEKF